jgi:hypothetical protein
LIVCEGEKTEPYYFRKFIEECNFRGRLVDVRVMDVKPSTPRELIKQAKKLREIPADEVWAVFDKNGYTRHAEAFSLAKKSEVNIAFSSISFEFWILLHYEYTTRSFGKSDEVINHLLKKGYINFQKKDRNLYDKIKDKTQKAINNAERVRKSQCKGNPDCPIYELNPYTDVDKLLHAIHKINK